jgi:hypothetical protein
MLNYTRIKPRSRPPQKKWAYFTHPEFSAAKIEKKVRKLREQIRYYSLHGCISEYIFCILLIYLLTEWSKVLIEKLMGTQLVKRFSAFYGTQRFITAFTSPRHPPLSWASSIQSIPLHLTSWKYILLLPSHLHLCLPSCLFPSGFPTAKNLVYNSRLPYTCYIPCPSFDHPKIIGWGL